MVLRPLLVQQLQRQLPLQLLVAVPCLVLAVLERQARPPLSGLQLLHLALQLPHQHLGPVVPVVLDPLGSGVQEVL